MKLETMLLPACTAKSPNSDDRYLSHRFFPPCVFSEYSFMLLLPYIPFTYEPTIFLCVSTSWFKIIVRENLCFLLEPKTRLVCSTDLPHLKANYRLCESFEIASKMVYTGFRERGDQNRAFTGTAKIVVKKKGG
jgi:hypothetical protein